MDFDAVFKGGNPYICDDLLEKDEWWPWGFKPNPSGYALIPRSLSRRAGVKSAFCFFSTRPRPVHASADDYLTDVSRAIAVAVANALAWAENERLRAQLEAENIALRDQLSQIIKFEKMVGDSEPLQTSA